MASVAGLLVPLVSPLTDDGSTLSEIRFSRMMRHYAQQGPGGYVVCSEAGEFWSLSLPERKDLAEWALRESQGLPVVVNVSAATTAASLDLCQHASRHGACAVVITPPPFGRLTAQEQLSHLRTVSRYGNIEMFVADAGLLDEATRQVLAEGVQTMARTSLCQWTEALPWSAARIYATPHTDEFVLSEGLATPLAIFGPQTVAQCFGERPQLIANMVQLLRAGGSGRVGRSALQETGIEVGPSRAPTQALADQHLPKLGELLEALRSLG